MKKTLIIFLSLIALYLILLIPISDNPLPQSPGQASFIWDKDALWNEMESKFLEAKDTPCEFVEKNISSSLRNYNLLLGVFDTKKFSYDNTVFQLMEYEFFKLAPMIAACPSRLNEYIELAVKVRQKVKEQSINWDMS
ncbi:MAG: hypothetical protein KAS62_03155, partial [Candidatus Delongbacteria bacterium]|nr:hypothetical protein [Candidatus Delongbacteria bacterium]